MIVKEHLLFENDDDCAMMKQRPWQWQPELAMIGCSRETPRRWGERISSINTRTDSGEVRLYGDAGVKWIKRKRTSDKHQPIRALPGRWHQTLWPIAARSFSARDCTTHHHQQQLLRISALARLDIPASEAAVLLIQASTSAAAAAAVRWVFFFLTKCLFRRVTRMWPSLSWLCWFWFRCVAVVLNVNGSVSLCWQRSSSSCLIWISKLRRGARRQWRTCLITHIKRKKGLNLPSS